MMKDKSKLDVPDEALIAEMQVEVNAERAELAKGTVEQKCDVTYESTPDGVVTTVSDDVLFADGLPVIEMVDRARYEVSDDALRALVLRNTPPWVFTMRRELVRVVQDENGAFLDPYNIDSLRGDLDRSAHYTRTARSHIAVSTITEAYVRDILARRRFPGFPSLRGVITAPCISPDGSLIDTPGYHEESGLYYAPGSGLESIRVSDRPTKEEVKMSIALISEVIVDFCFLDEASRANAFALIITPFVRPNIEGPVPLAIVSSPAQGTGKSLLADVTSILYTGTHYKGLMLESEAETQKRLTTALMKGRPIIVLDNLVGRVSSPSVARAVSESIWSSRLLGQNREVEIPVWVTWIGNGNNVGLSSEIVRRSYPIRLDAKMRRPHTRKGFRHPKLLAWVKKERTKIVSAILTLLKAYSVSLDRPPVDVPVMGLFGEWAELLGGILAFAEIPSFLGNLQEFWSEDDDEAQQWEILLLEVYRKYGGKPMEANKIAALPVEFFPEFLADYYERPSFPVRLGKALANIRDRVFNDDGLRVEKVKSVHGKSLWRVVTPTAHSDGPNIVPLPTVAASPAPLPKRSQTSQDDGSQVAPNLQAGQ